MESKGENKISKILDEKNVKFIREKRFKDCRDKLPLPFDFYLPEYNTCIEYDGTQHYYEIKHWNDLNYVKKHDKMKNDYCEEQEINLLRIKYNNNKIEKTILDFITLID
jgi:very-short-patch-repair endonuclease